MKIRSKNFLQQYVWPSSHRNFFLEQSRSNQKNSKSNQRRLIEKRYSHCCRVLTICSGTPLSPISFSSRTHTHYQWIVREFTEAFERISQGYTHSRVYFTLSLMSYLMCYTPELKF